MTVILHIPHDGHEFPEELRQFYVVSDEELKKYDYQMSDIYLNHIVKDIDCKKISFPISRLFCDVERLRENEPMEVFGMGFCYSHAYDGKKIKKVNDEVKNATLKYYEGHHQNLDDLVKHNPNAILIDLHTFNPKATRKELLTKSDIPDVCLGFSVEFCDSWIEEAVTKILEKYNYKVAINFPYSGSMVPNEVLKNPAKYQKFRSFMIEVNRDCYIGSDSFLIPKEHMRLYWTLKEICELF